MFKKAMTGLCLVVLATMPAALAQDAGLVNVLNVHLHLGQQQKYESALAKLWDAFEKAGVSHQISVSTSATQPGTYTFAAPVASLADLGALLEKVNQAVASVPSVAGDLQSSFRSEDQSVWAPRPDLSYTPANPRLQQSEVGYTRVAFLYPHPAQTQALEAALREVVAMRKKHGLTDGTRVGQLMIGSDGPAYAVLLDAESEADFAEHNAMAIEKMGADWQAYLSKVGPMLRSVELEGSIRRPDLDYQP